MDDTNLSANTSKIQCLQTSLHLSCRQVQQSANDQSNQKEVFNAEPSFHLATANKVQQSLMNSLGNLHFSPQICQFEKGKIKCQFVY